MTTQEHIESMIPTPRAVVESINQQVNQLEKSMKTTSTTQTPTGEITTVSIDGEAVSRFFGSGSAEAAKQFNDAANIAAENKRLREALESLIYAANQSGPISDPYYRIAIETSRAALKGGAQ